MKAIISIVLMLLTFSLWADSDRQAEGYFNTNQIEDGRFLVEFKGKNFDVRTYFPQNPKFYAQTAYHVMENPLIQFFLIVSPHHDVPDDHIIRMTLAEIANEYRGLNLVVVKKNASERKSKTTNGLTHTSQQFIIDLNNGFREFATLNLYRNANYDVSIMTRFTLSPEEKDNLQHRMHGNKITSQFHDDATVIQPE